MSKHAEQKRKTENTVYRHPELPLRTRVKTLSLACILAMGLLAQPLNATASAPLPADVQGHWALPYIEWATGEGLAQGYEDGTFKPQNLVTESEFLAMLLRSYQLVTKENEYGSSWSHAYYDYGQGLGWPLSFNNQRGGFKRGDAAKLLASSLNGKAFSETEAVQWLLDQGISQGRSSATVSGFQPGGDLTRAEALTFLFNVKQHSDSLSSTAVPTTRQSEVLGIAIGDSAAKASALLGQPQRVLETEYSYRWHIYNRDYDRFAMIGVLDGNVVALFTNAPAALNSTDKILIGQPLAGTLNELKDPSLSLKREENYFQYDKSGVQTTVFLDTQDQNRMIGFLQLDRSLSPKRAAQLGVKEQTDLEALLFEAANAERARRGIPVLEWDKQASASSRSHSADMANREYFAHATPEGASPFDRMKKEGISYRRASENIAAGFSNSLFAHYSLLNSKAGHRESLLSSELTRLGTGVAFGGPYRIYYTQNFYTPL